MLPFETIESFSYRVLFCMSHMTLYDLKSYGKKKTKNKVRSVSEVAEKEFPEMKCVVKRLFAFVKDYSRFLDSFSSKNPDIDSYKEWLIKVLNEGVYEDYSFISKLYEDKVSFIKDWTSKVFEMYNSDRYSLSDMNEEI